MKLFTLSVLMDASSSGSEAGPAVKASNHWLLLRQKPAVPLNVTHRREAAEAEKK